MKSKLSKPCHPLIQFVNLIHWIITLSLRPAPGSVYRWAILRPHRPALFAPSAKCSPNIYSVDSSAGPSHCFDSYEETSPDSYQEKIQWNSLMITFDLWTWILEFEKFEEVWETITNSLVTKHPVCSDLFTTLLSKDSLKTLHGKFQTK